MAKILLIDDVADVRMTVSVILEILDHDIIEADGGSAGIEHLRNDTFDLIITDILMPDVDGTEVMKFAHSLDNTPPILAISGGGQNIDLDDALNAAAEYSDMVLRKPFTAQEMRQAVETILKTG